ncbi:cupin-like domain-containing protein [Streptomyces sp. 13-12-16]|uniref:cupin-like domain-containing protein n=1 Tax=Streptomyces sp. 13-12-16 TaxID=1570823 RepID=UPI0015C40F8A|nr:cupin-like domain-containing protein [Streptomyces sp. 13-12-16]
MTDRNLISGIDQNEFIKSYLSKNKPLVSRGCFPGAEQPDSPWNLDLLARRFGNCHVPVFDSLFEMQQTVKFSDYASTIHDERSDEEPVPYMRWYARQRHFQMIRADKAFAEMADSWAAPSWLPSENYVFPPIERNADPVRDSFPAKGIFVCAAGGRTRLHVDPWASDAVLCQAFGEKRFVMYPPSAAEFLSDGESVIDLEHPDNVRFPRWRSISPTVAVTLSPGDAIFIPSGWFHAAVALTPSVSVTWNFVHEVNADRFAAYLEAGGSTDPTVRYFQGSR